MPLPTCRVKAALSGDTLVCVDTSAEAPAEFTMALAGLRAPRFSMRDVAGSEPYGFASREFIRQKLVGRVLRYEVERVLSETPRRLSCYAYIGSSVLVNEEIARAGWAQPRDFTLNTYRRKYVQGLPSAETIEQAAARCAAEEEGTRLPSSRVVEAYYQACYIRKCGMWSEEGKGAENPTLLDVFATDATTDAKEKLAAFLRAHKGQELRGVVEHVRDGSFMYATLYLPGAAEGGEEDSLVLQRAAISPFGVLCPSDSGTLQACAEEATQYVADCLLSRDAVIMPLTSFGGNALSCRITYKLKKDGPELDLSVELAARGYARVVEWLVSGEPSLADSLRSAEALAKEQREGIWGELEYDRGKPGARDGEDFPDAFSGTVVDVPTSDSVIVRQRDGLLHTVWLASLMAPRCLLGSQKPVLEEYGYECRNTLRSLLLGETVDVQVDYTKQVERRRRGGDADAVEEDQIEDREFATVRGPDGSNVAVRLIERGLARLQPHGHTDINRSSDYVAMRDAEDRAKEQQLGVYARPLVGGRISFGEHLPVTNIGSLNPGEIKSRAAAMAKDAGGRVRAVIESVINGSKARCSFTTSSGIMCIMPVAVAGVVTPSLKRDEAFAQEALDFARDRLSMQEVTLVLTGTVETHTNIIHARVLLSKAEEDYAELLLRAGLAEVLRRNPCNLSPSYLTFLHGVESTSKAERKGIFGLATATARLELPGTFRDPVFYSVYGFDVTQQGRLVFRLMDQDPPAVSMEALKAVGAHCVNESEVFIRKLVAYNVPETDAIFRARIEAIDKQNRVCRIYLVDKGMYEDAVPFKHLLAPLPRELETTPAVALTGKLAMLDTPCDAKAASYPAEVRSDFLETVRSAFAGRVNSVYTCGYTEGTTGAYGQELEVFVCEDDEPESLSPSATLSGYLLEVGLAKLVPAERLPRDAEELYDSLAEVEQEANKKRLGVWQ